VALPRFAFRVNFSYPWMSWQTALLESVDVVRRAHKRKAV